MATLFIPRLSLFSSLRNWSPVCTITALIAFTGLPASGAQNEEKAQAFFDSTNLITFLVELGNAEVQQLAQSPRSYVRGTVRVGERSFENVGVRLKGSGTFQPIYAHPSLTVKFNWKDAQQRFSGLTKLFLENSGQDATRLCKFIANGAFADGGIAAPRITQARVQLNGRDLGLCVVSEAINKDFLKHHFGSAEGNLYEGEFRDIGVGLKQDNGTPSDQSDLRELRDAATQQDRTQRKQALARIFETDEFLDFLAIEMIIANWDGYAFQQNNYRIYHNPFSGRMSFIPHDLDNTFAESGMSLMPPRNGILTTALLETPEERDAFRARVAALAPKVLDQGTIRVRVQAGVARLKQGATSAEAEVIDRQAALLQRRIEERTRHLEEELNGTHPPTPTFDASGVARLEGWSAKPDWNSSSVKAIVSGGKACFCIQAANGYCFGSWRLPVWLPAGTYRMEGSAKTRGVMGLPSRTGSGAGVRVLGKRRGSGVQDSNDWTPVVHNFVVQEGCEWAELIAELRAYQGTAWFDPETLRLIRVN